MSQFLSLDEEGYFLSNGLRWHDADLGKSLFQSLGRAPSGAYQVAMAGKPHILEAFDQPLVAQSVNVIGAGLELNFPYGYQGTLKPQTLCCDDFDRFHGHTAQGIPFVLSRKAQAQLFEAAEEFDDDGLVLGGERIDVGPWLVENAPANKLDFWQNFYNGGDTPWDLAGPHPGLVETLPSLKLPRSRIAVLGCGRGHDAAHLAAGGHIVTAFDFSDEALAAARATYGDIPGLQFVKADAFALPEKYFGQFDIVFEHTFFCAVVPRERNRLISLWRRLLVPSGFLLGIFFVVEKRTGPPWGGTEWELRERLKRFFEPVFWRRIRVGPVGRLGREVLILNRKASG